MHDGRSDAQVICAGGSVEQELVRVQLFLVYFHHRTHFLHCCRDVLGVPALDGVVAVGGGVLVFLEGPRLNIAEHGSGFLGSH